MRLLLKHRLRLVALAWLAVAAGCANRDAASAPGPKAPVARPPARKNDADNPRVKEARADTEAVLNDLLAGKYDADANFAPVARKLKGYTGWTITAQEADPDNPQAVHFDGTLTSPSGNATFTAYMVKQQNGRWMIGSFSGPRRE